MKLQDQVCTREQAQRLKSLGIAGYSYFYHGSHGEIIEEWSIEGIEDDFRCAWTVAELGEMLRAYWGAGHAFNPAGAGWYHTWHKNERAQPILGPYPTEAQARAAMLIYLLENDHVTAEEVNKRLNG